VAAAHLNNDEELVRQVKKDFHKAAISEKLKALLVIAGQVQQGGKKVSEAAVARAREEGATDLEIHDTVLIAAAFCMFNRYVDGLATFAPEESAEIYRRRGQQLAQQGYSQANRELMKK
jgi:alkylhydroperoxidase/carboxymuconolactone decarboxylase family protein YurZ